MRERRGLGRAALLALLLAASLAGCAKRRPMAPEASQEAVSPAAELKSLGYTASRAQDARAGTAPAAGPPEAPAPPASVPAVRKLIRRVELDLAVGDTESSARAAQELAERSQGYVESMSARRSGELMYYELTLRIPSPRLDGLLAELKKRAERIDREQQGTEDVTSQYVDLTARMKTLKGTESELQALLAESRSRGRKAGEIMEIFRELTEIRTQIEQIESQVRTFDQLAALSTLRLTLAPVESAKPVAEPGWAPWNTVRSAFRSLVSLLRGGIDLSIFLVVVVLPFLLLLWLAWVGLRRLLRALRRRRDA